MTNLYSLLFVILLSALIPKCESYIDDDGNDIVTLNGEAMGMIFMEYLDLFREEMSQVYVKGDSFEDLKKKIPEVMEPTEKIIKDEKSTKYPHLILVIQLSMYRSYLDVSKDINPAWKDDSNYNIIWNKYIETAGNMAYEEGDKVIDIMHKIGALYNGDDDDDKRDIADLVILAEKIFLEHQYPIKEPVRLAGNVYIDEPITFDVYFGSTTNRNDKQMESFEILDKELKEIETMCDDEYKLKEMIEHLNSNPCFSTCNTIWDTRIRKNISIHDPVEIFDKEMEEYLEIIPVLINNANNTMIKWNETERIIREKGWFNRCDKLDLDEIEYDYGYFHVFIEYNWFQWLKEYERVDDYFKKIKTKPCPYMGGYYGKESENWWIVRFRSDIKEHIIKVEGQLPFIKKIVDKDPKTLKFFNYSPEYRRMRERYRSSKEVDELICYTNIMDYIIEQVNINRDDTEIDRLITDVRKRWEGPPTPGNCGPYCGIFDYDCNNLAIVAGF